ncbi:MAG TPA: PRC-barrel domain-containing protein [Armatimonadota bacterium]
MTETSGNPPGTQEPLILERLSDLQEQFEYLAHYPDIRGWLVVNPLDDEVGVVEDLYVNPRDQQVEMAAITFNNATGYGGKRVLVPVEEIDIMEGRIRILTHAERIRLAPEFHEGAPSYEPYYEYWATALVGYEDEPGRGVIRPPGRLELENEDEDTEIEIEGRVR